MNLDLQAGENASSLTVRLPNDTPTGQTLMVSVSLRGHTSNKARIRM